MTKEDIKQICQIYDNFRSERDAATITYNSDDTFWEHILATYNLSQPSFLSNLDEAVLKYEEFSDYPPASQEEMLVVYNAFKAGAEWMAGQGETHEAEIIESVPFGGTKWQRSIKVWLDDKFQAKGDKVIVQIRKK